jgi:hypothetical protein
VILKCYELQEMGPEESTSVPADQAAEQQAQLSIPALEDELSMSPSLNSRKDSGIRSNSRRSSIQQQVCLNLHHTVHDCFNIWCLFVAVCDEWSGSE